MKRIPEGTRLLQAESSTLRLLSFEVGFPRSRHRSMSPHRAKRSDSKDPKASSLPPGHTKQHHQGFPLLEAEEEPSPIPVFGVLIHELSVKSRGGDSSAQPLQQAQLPC